MSVYNALHQCDYVSASLCSYACAITSISRSSTHRYFTALQHPTVFVALNREVFYKAQSRPDFEFLLQLFNTVCTVWPNLVTRCKARVCCQNYATCSVKMAVLPIFTQKL